MYYILNQPIKSNQLILRALMQFKGISYKTALLIIAQLNLGKKCFVHKLPKYKIDLLNKFVKQFFLVNADLTQFHYKSISKLILIGSYKGFRHRKFLPVRGQRTRSNAETRRAQNKTFKKF